MKVQSKHLAAGGTLLFSIILFLNACQKDLTTATETVPTGQSRLSVYLTDGPYDYQQVLLDIQQVAVKLDTCERNSNEDRDQPGCDGDHDQRNSDCEVWDTLNIQPGLYNLTQLRNGIDTLLGSAVMQAGKVKRIKFTLGDNNSVMVDSVTHPLQLINNQHFVYLNIKREHLDSTSSANFQLHLDADLAKSIRYINGVYWLKPVLKPFSQQSFGEIEGKIQPANSFGMIKAFNDADSSFASPWQNGEFKIRGLKPGTYNLFVQGANGYRDTTINNVIVTNNKEAQIGTLQLNQ